jgi:gamma-glutamyltranspeptidase/glutathione hydrolase
MDKLLLLIKRQSRPAKKITLANFSVVMAAWMLAGCFSLPGVQPPSHSTSRAPEPATGYTEKPGWVAKKYMLASANPLASEAGYQMLKAGGSAIDAAIAAQMVLTLVEPQSSGIGGGAFLLHYDGRIIKAYDGRETAPQGADEKLFQTPDGKAMEFFDGAVGGRSVGVPGVLRMLELAHKEYGALPWRTLFEPAIELAENGFEVSPRLATLIRMDMYLRKDPVAAAYFYDREGKPWPAGHVLKNPMLAQTLRLIASHGADVFYHGEIAQDIERKVRLHAGNPGQLTVADMASYQAKVREPVCSDYKRWTLCGMPPPSSGGVAIAQMLGMLEEKNMQTFPPHEGNLDVQAVHLFSEAGRLAYADRNRYVADPDFVPLPGKSIRPLLDKKYLAQRAKLIGTMSMGTAAPGMPLAVDPQWGSDALSERPSTTHLSVVDGNGRMLAMTSTIEDAFGSRQMVRGFLLNNELTDFSFESMDANGPVANRVEGGKRPRSSMSPTLVREKESGKMVLAIGSPGGSAIPNYVAKVLIAMMDWGLDVQKAIDLPNFGSRNGPTELERGRVSDELIQELREKGHALQIIEQTSGLHGIMRMTVHGEEIWFAGADPRREGTAKGD